MHRLIQISAIGRALAASLLFSSCATQGGNRVLLGLDVDADPLTDASRRILAAASRFKPHTYAMNSMELRLAGLRDYEVDLRPHLTESFDRLLRDYITVKLTAFNTGGPQKEHDKAQDDPVLQRRWEPDVAVLSREYGDEEDEGIVVVNELLLDGKIWTGYQGESRFHFKLVDGSWLLDDVITRRRYSYDDSTWDTPESTREQLEQAIKTYSGFLKAKGEQGVVRDPPPAPSSAEPSEE